MANSGSHALRWGIVLLIFVVIGVSGVGVVGVGVVGVGVVGVGVVGVGVVVDVVSFLPFLHLEEPVRPHRFPFSRWPVMRERASGIVFKRPGRYPICGS